MDGDTLVFPKLLSMFPSGLPGIAPMPAGVAIGDRALESALSAIH